MVKSVHLGNSSIFHSPEVCVVEASAGSGKTFTLAKRYVQLLLNAAPRSAPLRSILAITFTNKAALEMKARILEFLKKTALKRLSAVEYREILSPLELSDDEASSRAFAVMETLIRNYNFFQVQTIDSFINALLSGCSFKIRLSANFGIKRNTREYITSGLDRLIDRSFEDKDARKHLEVFLHQYLFIENRSGWFPKKDLLKLMATLFAQSNFFSGDFVALPFSGDDIFARKKIILKLMSELRDELPENTHADFRKRLIEFLNDHQDSFDIDTISERFANEDFPYTKGKASVHSVDRLWKTIREELKDLCEMEAMSLFNPYIEVFRLTLQELKAIAVKEDVLFLEELNKKARGLFDDGLVTVEELYYRLATRFHHYMVDEFQDTSRLQWDNFSLMVEEALSTGGSLFYVGDKKQAIYGFRGGDSSLFDEIKERYVRYVREEKLDNNYRSRRNIVEFNNMIFSKDNLERFIARKEEHDLEKNKKNAVCFSDDDRNDILNVFANSRQNARPGNDGGLVRIEHIDGDKKEDREEVSRLKILELIAELRSRFTLGDIAILTRNNKEVEEITGWLLHEGIPVDSERTSNILGNATVSELTALLRFLDSPIDNVSFADFILSDVFARAAGIQTGVFHEFIFGLRPRLSGESSFYLYREFRRCFGELWERYFEDFFKNVGLYPLYEFTVSVIERLGVHRNFPGDRGFLMHFLEIIKRRESDYGDLTAFLEYFEDPLTEDLFVNVSSKDAVRILTVHKSKGLEFSVAILPSLEMDIEVGSGGKDGQQSFIIHHLEDGTHLVRLKKKYRSYSERLNRLYEREYKKDFLSQLNSVYVALTRAVSELYIFIPAKAGNSTNVAQFLVPQEVMAIGEPVVRPASKREDKKRVELMPSFSRDWMVFLQEEFSAESTQNHQLRLKGELTHYILSFVLN